MLGRRAPRTTGDRQKVTDIVVIVLFAALTNAEFWKETVISQRVHLRQYMEQPSRTPAYDTMTAISERICRKRGAYVLAVKGNRGPLCGNFLKAALPGYAEPGEAD